MPIRTRRAASASASAQPQSPLRPNSNSNSNANSSASVNIASQTHNRAQTSFTPPDLIVSSSSQSREGIAGTASSSSLLRVPPLIKRRSTRARTTGHSPSPSASPEPPLDSRGVSHVDADADGWVSVSPSPATVSTVPELDPSTSSVSASASASASGSGSFTPLARATEGDEDDLDLVLGIGAAHGLSSRNTSSGEATKDRIIGTDNLLESPTSTSGYTSSMFGRAGPGLRGRNVEDIAVLEEQGLLTHRRDTSKDLSKLKSGGGAQGQGQGAIDEYLDEKKRAGYLAAQASLKGHDVYEGGSGSGSVEKVTMPLLVSNGDDENEGGGEGLNSPRDRQAFALLVVLCEFRIRCCFACA